MSQLPKGTVTLLFSDIESSTRLLEHLGDRYVAVLRDYHELVRGAVLEHGGTPVDVAGDGLFSSFPSAKSALSAAIAAQRALQRHGWAESAQVQVRMGLHTGEPLSSEAQYIGMDVHRAARICAVGHGGQILLSHTVRVLIGNDLPPGVALRDLGEHRLKDLSSPERLFQPIVEDLPNEFAPIRSLDTLPNNLPRQLSSFIGRSETVSEVEALLASTPLLSLTGPGGVGKTRLALEVAASSVDAFRDGAWLVDLGSLADEELVLPTIASTLRIKEQPGSPLLRTVVEALADRQMLLVLDDCEHVLEACAAVANQLLQGCTELRILATTREPLGVAGERLFPVPSMSLPDEADAADPETVTRSEAVALFVERARAVAPSFALTAHNAAAIGQVCQRLDGIPLAVELAAARVRALPPEQIAARLDDRFRLLTGGSRTALPRHRTLRAAMDWSFDTLSESERVLLARLSVFSGGFSLEAVEAVCATDPIDPAEVLDLLSHLVDCSLVVVEEHPDEARYRLLETVRQYAEDRLIAVGEPERTHSLHRDWFLRLVEQAKPAFFSGPEPASWLDRLGREHDNLRAALRWSHEDPQGVDAELRLAAGLWRFWEIRHLVEGLGFLERMLDRPGAQVSELRANALTGAGILAYNQGSFDKAFSFHEASLILHRQLGNPGSIAFAANNLANVAVERGDYARARELFAEAMNGAPDARGTAMALVNLAELAGRQAEYDEARSLYERAIATFRQFGDQWGMAYAVGRSAQTSRRQGDLTAAAEQHQHALDLYRGVGDSRGAARTLIQLGEVAAELGDPTRAQALYGESLALRRELGDRAGIAAALEHLAWLATPGRPDRAARLLGAAESIRDSVGAPLPPTEVDAYQANLAGLRLAGAEDELRRSWREGRAMTIEAAAAYATEPSRG